MNAGMLRKKNAERQPHSVAIAAAIGTSRIPQQLTGLVDAHHLRALHLRVVVGEQRLRRRVVARVRAAPSAIRAPSRLA